MNPRFSLCDAHRHLAPEEGGEGDAGGASGGGGGNGGSGTAGEVVNAVSEADWDAVAALAAAAPERVIPAFGIHPWRAGGTAAGWERRLREILARFPSAAVGEIGLDRSRRTTGAGGAGDAAAVFARQREVLRVQLALAREMNRVAVLHCVAAAGALESALRETPPARPFLLHGFNGSVEQARVFAKLGARFSFSADFFAGTRRNPAKRRALVASIAPDRLLVETDAAGVFAAAEARHAALFAGYTAAASARGEPLEAFAARVAENFRALFRHA